MTREKHDSVLQKQAEYIALHRYQRHLQIALGGGLFDRLGRYGRNILVVKREYSTVPKNEYVEDEWLVDLMEDDRIPMRESDVNFDGLLAIKEYIIRYYEQYNLYE